jgi:hypothetical protein
MIKKAYENIEKARMELYWAVNDEIKRGEIPTETLPCDEWKAEYKNNVIKIVIPDYPPKTLYAKKAAKQRWINNVMFAIKSLNPLPQFEHIFVFVDFYIPSKDWDVDNRDVSPIIDGIRYSQIIKDDTYEHVSFGYRGHYSEDPHTDIYIIGNFNINEVVDNFIKNGNVIF